MFSKTLLIRHIPSRFTSDDCNDLFGRFGARKVRYMGTDGKMKHTAFALFDNENEARIALNHLHQLTIVDRRLVVEYSDRDFIDDLDLPSRRLLEQSNKEKVETSKLSLSQQIDSQLAECRRRISREINSISNFFNFEYTINPNLRYSYPKPTVTILTNIANALATVPKFYTQVLHLMNKMNLPAPFGNLTLTPPIVDDSKSNASNLISKNITEQVSDESEIGSDGENTEKSESTKKRKKSKDHDLLTRKKIKLQLTMEAQMQALSEIHAKTVTAAKVSAEKVFEDADKVSKTKKIDIKISNEDISNIGSIVNDTEVSDGFGKLTPVVETVRKPISTQEQEWDVDDFIPKEEIMKNRLNKNEYQTINAFKNYAPGQKSSRLYLKNLGKSVTERDLHLIFGNFVDWSSQEERIMYDIRLMKEGRMKGQAFITLPSDSQAEQALQCVNGYKLLGKPVAIYFARSAKPKQ